MVARGGLVRVRPFTWLPQGRYIGAASCLGDSSGISRGRALERLARLRPQAADLGLTFQDRPHLVVRLAASSRF